MTLLINGGSDFIHWKPSKDFLKSIKCESYENICREGTGLDRLCRTTTEWIAINGCPKFAIFSVPHITRFELAISNDQSTLDAGWLPVQNSNHIDLTQLNDLVSPSMVKELVDLLQGVIPDMRQWYEASFSKILIFTGYLKSIGVKHVIMNGCNDIDRKHIKGLKGFEKLNLLGKDESVIDFFDFVVSLWCFERASESDKAQWLHDPYNYHPTVNDWPKLEKYFVNYINGCTTLS